ncbi:Adenine DNA glycosylase [Rhynchospora pubera]|uniref:Adenine DNA glycosylase n=1 Tax=Rhynchospora pubera TaxID=906938 RepID=A0AAV8C715_9POAL|nr:Adenine DNA glycosylase [Rhynchospora pubera]
MMSFVSFLVVSISGTLEIPPLFPPSFPSSKLLTTRQTLSPSISMDTKPNPQTSTQLRRSTRLTSKRIPTITPSSQPVPKNKTRDIEDCFSQDEADSVRASLLRWYDINQRELPWRRKHGCGCAGDAKERRAYEVWVSEVMLQQTRVATVVAYYNRWMQRWPTVHCLATASQEEVNEMWSGLGYYRRARYLLEGAKSIAKEGRFPRNATELRGVPGIGNYTAGAVASIAFNEAVPVVDGNVVRVISRLNAISSNPKDSSTVKHIWDLAGQLVDKSRPGDLNQALMELGATICMPKNPNCINCPVSDQCRALSLSRLETSTIKVTDFPPKVIKSKQRLEFAAVCVILVQNDSCENQKHVTENFYLLVKRPEKGLLAGLWEFPMVLVAERRTDMESRRKEMDEYLKNLKLDFGEEFNLVSREEVGEYLHIFSHIRLRMHVELMLLTTKGGLNQLENQGQDCQVVWKFVHDSTMESTGLTSGIRKVYNMTQEFRSKQMSTNTRT